jgi:hypothetical protein
MCWRFSSIFVLPLVLVAAVSAGIRPADQKLAKQMTLRRDDFSANARGWTVQPVPPTRFALSSEPLCLYSHPRLLTGFSASPFFWSQAESTGETAESATYVFASVAAARTAARWFQKSHFLACIGASIGQRLITTDVTSARLTIRCPAAHGHCPFAVTARRFHGTANMAADSESQPNDPSAGKMDEYDDLVVLRRTRVVVVFRFSSSSRPYDSRDETLVLKRVGARSP